MAATLEHFHPTALALYHRNPRIGDVGIIEDSLRVNGQYRPIVVNRGTHTGRPNEVLAGNHTLKAFRNLLEREGEADTRWHEVAGYVIDVDDDRAARIVAADNRTAELGTFDDVALHDLLAGLPDLEGTGYTPEAFAALDDLLAGPTGLDDLADTYGDPKTGDGLDKITLEVSAGMAERWGEYRGAYASDEAALDALFAGNDA